MLTNKTLLNSCFMKSQQLEKLSINNLVKFRLPRILAIERLNLPQTHNHTF